jgi:hypothetical protein
VQVAVLAVVHLPRALVDLQRDADVALLEDGREMRAHVGQQFVAGLFFTASERPAAMRMLRYTKA